MTTVTGMTLKGQRHKTRKHPLMWRAEVEATVPAVTLSRSLSPRHKRGVCYLGVRTMSSTIAPNEKHLEDWIVSNLSDIPDFAGISGETFSILGRQVTLPSGIPDILASVPGVGIHVIELKVGRITGKTLAQVLRYIHDIQGIQKITLDLIRDPIVPDLRVIDPSISGILVGHSIEDENILIAARAANVSIVLYEYNEAEGEYTFTDQSIAPLDLMVRYQYSNGIIGDVIRQIYYENAELAAQDPDHFMMITDAPKLFDLFLLETRLGIVPWYAHKDDSPSKTDD